MSLWEQTGNNRRALQGGSSCSLSARGDQGVSPTSDTASESAAEVLTVWDSASVPCSQSQNCTLPKESALTTVPLERREMAHTTHSRLAFSAWWFTMILCTVWPGVREGWGWPGDPRCTAGPVGAVSARGWDGIMG